MRILVVLMIALLAATQALGQENSPGGQEKNSAKTPAALAAKPTGAAAVHLQKKLAELKALQAEVDQLRRAAGIEPQQIMIQVQIMKISRTKLEELGYDLSEGGIAGLLARDGKPAGPAETGKAATKAIAAGLNRIESATLEPGSHCKALINAWKKQERVLELVGEPTVVTVSGRPAYWHVGGAFPRLVPAPGGAVATEMMSYGVQLDALPQLLDDGRVRLQLRPRVSELDESQTITVNGIKIPGLRTREVDTAVELKPGQTFAVSGLGRIARRKGERGWSLQREEIIEQVEMLVVAKVEFVDAMVPLDVEDRSSGHDETPR
jgi:pilus assembly protein CpaC